MTKASSFLGIYTLLCLFGLSTAPLLAQTARITPKVGINTRTPEYTLDVNGKMRVAVVEETNQSATHLLAIDKTTKQVVKTPISELNVIKRIEKTNIPHPANGVATFEFPITDIDPATQVAILLRANLRTTYKDQNHRQFLLSVADDPTKAADKRNTLMPSFVQYAVNGGRPPEPNAFCGRWAGSNDQYALRTTLGTDNNNSPISNSLMTTTKQVELKPNAAGTAYVFTGTYGRAVIAAPGGTLQWNVAVLVFDKKWASQSQQVVRVKADGSLRNQDGSTYTPFYSRDPLRLSNRPQVNPIHQGESELRGTGTTGATIRVSQNNNGSTNQLPTVVVDANGEWRVPVSGISTSTTFDVVQVEQVDGRNLPQSLVVRNIVRSHDPMASTDPQNPLVDQATQAARTRVGIGTRAPEKTLDVVGTWGIRDAPPYPYEDALLLGVDGNSQTIQKVRSGRRAIYTFTLAANNTNIDWINSLNLMRLHPDYTLVATRAALSRSELVNGKYHSFDENNPERSAAYLGVQNFTSVTDTGPLGYIVVHNRGFRRTTGNTAYWTSNQTLAGNYTNPSAPGAILFPDNRFTNPIRLDYWGVTPVSKNYPHAWRVNYLAIRKSWMKL